MSSFSRNAGYVWRLGIILSKVVRAHPSAVDFLQRLRRVVHASVPSDG